ncbi:MAG: sigma-54 dependent transcriptional regulator [Holosporaceae bacterium]|jgi:transcriptional regulator with PAS, ATPase and Fis domain|nr:sigma-54 dependent transcriptional regulator [Holosporaceae bacterium]
MKIIVVGDKLERSMFEIVSTSRIFDCNTLFFKEHIKAPIGPKDVIVIDGDLIHALPQDIKNTVISVVTSTNYAVSLENEVSICPHELKSIAGIIRSKTANYPIPIAVDPITKSVFQIADRIATTDATVLITGETGTGKEIMARYIHKNSSRASEHYVAINCAAIPETLLESELFGHERGAFTNAIQRRIGKFEEANRGTILLDEISEIPPYLQSKLLRVIQEKEISRLGGNGTINIDIRIIATSNCDLFKAVSNGKFREDLFYRLNIIQIEMPTLNDRSLDIEPLAKFFCDKYSAGQKSLSPRVIAMIKKHSWKGNIRELENFIHRSVLLSPGKIIDDFIVNPHTRTKTLMQMEQETILNTIEKFNGNKTLTSKELGIPLRTLYHKLNSYKAS